MIRSKRSAPPKSRSNSKPSSNSSSSSKTTTTPARERNSLASRVQAVAIDPQDPAEATVLVGGRVVLRAAILDLDELGVRAGVAWSAVLKRRIEHSGAVRQARSDALELLADSPRGEPALRRALARQGHAPASIAAAIKALREEGWLAPAATTRRGAKSRRRSPA